MRLRLLLIVLTATWSATACGGAPAPRPDPEADLRRAFLQIQAHEADLEKHRAELARPAGACDRACPELEGLCAASRSICAIAEEVMDRDALARCASAQRSCRAETARFAGTCECPGRPKRPRKDEPSEAGSGAEAIEDDE
jgi:hypothetical protein